jgi:hypothetical protein
LAVPNDVISKIWLKFITNVSFPPTLSVHLYWNSSFSGAGLLKKYIFYRHTITANEVSKVRFIFADKMNFFPLSCDYRIKCRVFANSRENGDNQACSGKSIWPGRNCPLLRIRRNLISQNSATLIPKNYRKCLIIYTIHT